MEGLPDQGKGSVEKMGKTNFFNTAHPMNLGSLVEGWDSASFRYRFPQQSDQIFRFPV